MMIFKSIKWRLQIWYGLILVVVLAGFGFTAYQLERGRTLGRIDDELHRRFNVLAQALHRPPGGPERDGPPFDSPPPGQLPDDGLTGQNPRPPLEFRLPPQAAGLFDTNDSNGFYFVIKARDGKEIAHAGNVPTLSSGILRMIDSTVEANVPHESPANPTALKPPQYNGDIQYDPEGRYRDRRIPATLPIIHGEFRELQMETPPGENILVGCSIAPELKELRRTALNLTAVGGLILLIGLAGGWWLVSRAIKPIEDISSTAAKISASDLSQRINVAEAESELGKLASVLNSTFARLDAAFTQQKQFASDAAHELRTPVAVVLTQTQTALNRERTAPEYRETVEACQRAAQRMRKLIGALLELARLDAGQEEMKRMKFDLSQTARDCVELIRPLADKRGVKIVSELPPLEIIGDSERIAQVITNLLTNAIQYNNPDGEVRITAQMQAGAVILTVTDTGPGISAEDLPRVFERFYRADKSRSSANNGLGLAISKAIVEAHGGEIEVSSEKDYGTTFTVRLPAAS
jgi:heavy metal sensor kinase